MKKELENKINDYIEKVEKFKNEHKMNFLDRFCHKAEGIMTFLIPVSGLTITILFLIKKMYGLIILLLIINIINIILIILYSSKYDKTKNYKIELFNEIFNDNDLNNLYSNYDKELENKIKTDKLLKIEIDLPYSCALPIFYYRIYFYEYRNIIIKNIIKTLKLEDEYYDNQEWFGKFTRINKSLDKYLKVKIYKLIKKKVGKIKIIDKKSYYKATEKWNFIFTATGNVNDKNYLIERVIANWPKDSKGYCVSYDDKIAEKLIESSIENFKAVETKRIKDSIFKSRIKEDLQELDIKVYFYKLGISWYSVYIKEDIQKIIYDINNKLYKEERINELYRYKNHCWNCGSSIDSKNNERCDDCGWYICSRCGACSQEKNHHKNKYI